MMILDKKDHRNQGLRRALTHIINRQNLALILFAVLMCSCVSIKSYRQTKAQMLFNEFEIERYIFITDSLELETDSLEQLIVVKDSTMHSQDSILTLKERRITVLTEEYALLMEELKAQAQK